LPQQLFFVAFIVRFIHGRMFDRFLRVNIDRFDWQFVFDLVWFRGWIARRRFWVAGAIQLGDQSVNRLQSLLLAWSTNPWQVRQVRMIVGFTRCFDTAVKQGLLNVAAEIQ
jgi:hypothetical protein